jgi:two-component system nitrate/nitrite sensor histidine kinase NarX
MARVSTNGTYLQVNQSLCRMFGYSAPELLQKTFQELTYPDDLEVGLDLFRNLITGKRDYGWLKKRYVHQDGRVIWAQLSTSVVRDSQGTPLYLVSQIQDITDQVRAYQLLEQRVAERTRELATLLEISRTIASTLELEPLLDLILDQLKVMIDYTSASLFSLQGDTLEMVAYRGPRPPEQVLQIRIPVDSDLRETLGGRPEPLVFADILSEESAARNFRQIIDGHLAEPIEHVHSAIWLPLLVKQRVIGGLGVTHTEVGYFTERHAALALTIANQAAIAIENAKLYEQAQAFATLQERQRLARELHDAVTQMLFSASLIAEVLPRLWEIDQVEAQAYLEDLRRLTRGALAEMRALLLELRPASLAETDLGDLLGQLADATAGRARLPVEVEVEVERSLPIEIKIALYRVAQEALNNVVKHARANHVTISLREVPASGEAGNGTGIALCIRDDGRGFDPTYPCPERFGLIIMRERAEAIGATLSIESQPGQGAQVILRWTGSQARQPTIERPL